MWIHDETAAAIEANVPGHAQMARGGDPHDIVSWHNHGFTETRYSGWDTRDACCAFIDAWAQGEARVTLGTFSDHEILHRAQQWEHGSGPHIQRGNKNPAFAEQVRSLAAPQGNRRRSSRPPTRSASAPDPSQSRIITEQA